MDLNLTWFVSVRRPCLIGLRIYFLFNASFKYNHSEEFSLYNDYNLFIVTMIYAMTSTGQATQPVIVKHEGGQRWQKGTVFNGH